MAQHRVEVSEPTSVGLSKTEAEVYLRAIVWSADLALIRRFYRQPFWRIEGARAAVATWIERHRPLENVADHSWKVADACMLLQHLVVLDDPRRVAALAVLHDKLEMLTGDWSAIDADGTGESTHAFNPAVARVRSLDELRALDSYLGHLPRAARDYQRDLLREMIDCSSKEARFVYGVDKLMAIVFALQKKGSRIHPVDLAFTRRYSAKAVAACAELRPIIELALEAFTDGTLRSRLLTK